MHRFLARNCYLKKKIEQFLFPKYARMKTACYILYRSILHKNYLSTVLRENLKIIFFFGELSSVKVPEDSTSAHSTVIHSRTTENGEFPLKPQIAQSAMRLIKKPAS